MSRRIPSRVRILDCLITVKQVPREVVSEAVGAKDSKGADGCWLDEEMRILIDRRLSQRNKRITYLHELRHALIDIAEWEHDKPG